MGNAGRLRENGGRYLKNNILTPLSTYQPRNKSGRNVVLLSCFVANGDVSDRREAEDEVEGGLAGLDVRRVNFGC